MRCKGRGWLDAVRVLDNLDDSVCTQIVCVRSSMIDPVAYIGLALAILFPFLQWKYEKTPKWFSDLGIGLGCIVFGIGLSPVVGNHVLLNDHETATPKEDTPKAAPPPVIATAEASVLQNLDITGLQDVVTKLSKQMRETDVAYGHEEERIMLQGFPRGLPPNQQMANWNDRKKQMEEVQRNLDAEWQVKYRARAKAAYEELCRRLAIVPYMMEHTAPDVMQDEAISLLQTGMLAGSHPMSALADYLDSLSNQLN